MVGTARKLRMLPLGQRHRWFGHPAVIAIFAGLLIADYLSTPGGYWRGGSLVKSAAEQMFSGRSVTPRMFPAFFVKMNDGIDMVWDWHEPIPGQRTLHPPQQRWRLHEWPDYQSWKPHGLYHITRFERSFDFRGDHPPEARARMMALFVERFDALPPSHEMRMWPTLHEIRRLYANGVSSEHAAVPIGYYRNAVAGTILMLLFIAVRRGRTDLWIIAGLAKIGRQDAPGRCPNCGYDSIGLEVCPECGTRAETART